ncbi:hypothetical protein GGR55DRAFT_650771 [Xylaria sp. FL0064]|nr:hypothetical protein GGR55DRAFT_650771 [Xylaria sp. FL0064]
MSTMAELSHQRVLSDIHELVTEPYPKITLHPHENNLKLACLILCPENYPPLHLTIRFSRKYPIIPPFVRIDSSIQHPNVRRNRIYASILYIGDGYTPAYTLKGIAIQLLSFFDSDSLEQEHSSQAVRLDTYHAMDNSQSVDTYECAECEFGMKDKDGQTTAPSMPTGSAATVDQCPKSCPTLNLVQSFAPHNMEWNQRSTSMSSQKSTGRDKDGPINQVPNEVLLLIIESLDFEHLTNFTQAWPRVSQLVQDFDIIRQRELQCFCLKRSYLSAKLGVGVKVLGGQICSEFDLISEEAYRQMDLRRSVYNEGFRHWLPLPLSTRHWNKVREEAHRALTRIASRLRTSPSSGSLNAHALFTFMNDIVVRLNPTTEEMDTYGSTESTLCHASEKAIESYFHLFHLLVCLAAEDSSIVQQANKLLRAFENGKTSKTDCPNLGHLLIALLISDVQVTDTLIRSIITEATVRHVVWLLDSKGAGMAELSYMERNAVSDYRLEKTFQGSLTSYRLMFSELFRRTVRPSHKKTLTQVRDELFERHGAPPRDAAGHLAAEVRRLHTIDNYPAFMREMGLQNIPTSMNLTELLRAAVHESMNRGYSRWAIDQEQAMRLRIQKDPHIQYTASLYRAVISMPSCFARENDSPIC